MASSKQLAFDGTFGGNGQNRAALRGLPAIHTVLACVEAEALSAELPRDLLVESARAILGEARADVLAGVGPIDLAPQSLATAAISLARKIHRPFHCRVINATGIVLHTNLGRAPLAKAALAAALAVSGYSNLEFDLGTGKRGKRIAGVGPLISRLLGAESGTAVNNCAGATVLVLRALCAGREVVVSRGQLVEIGGNFRLPEIFEVAGVRLIEVGTTNITRIEDYRRAINLQTAALLRVHTSNYRVTGHTEAPGAKAMALLAREKGVWFIDDVGSGAVHFASLPGFEDEPDPRIGLLAGAHLTLMSGDKLLGGPQAGLVAGQADLIQLVEKDPLFRALRLDKMSLAALEATLRLHLDPDRAWREVPALAMLGLSADQISQRAQVWAGQLTGAPGLESLAVIPERSPAGGGALPGQSLPTWVVALRGRGKSDDRLAAELRNQSPPIICRVQGGLVLLDPRTVTIEEEVEMLVGVKSALRESQTGG